MKQIYVVVQHSAGHWVPIGAYMELRWAQARQRAANALHRLKKERHPLDQPWPQFKPTVSVEIYSVDIVDDYNSGGHVAWVVSPVTPSPGVFETFPTLEMAKETAKALANETGRAYKVQEVREVYYAEPVRELSGGVRLDEGAADISSCSASADDRRDDSRASDDESTRDSAGY